MVELRGSFHPDQIQVGEVFLINGRRYRMTDVRIGGATAEPVIDSPKQALIPRPAVEPWYRQFDKRGRR